MQQWKTVNAVSCYSRLMDLDGRVVFDVGAAEGDYTQAFLLLGAGRVVAVEPRLPPELVARFRGEDRVKLVGKGVASKARTEVLYVNEKHPDGSTFSKDFMTIPRYEDEYSGTLTPVEIEMTTLDDLIAEHGLPEFAKVDVEGYELEAIEGLSHRIPLISFEVTLEVLETALEVVALLVDRGYTRFAYVEPDHRPEVVMPWSSRDISIAFIQERLGSIPVGDLIAR